MIKGPEDWGRATEQIVRGILGSFRAIHITLSFLVISLVLAGAGAGVYGFLVLKKEQKETKSAVEILNIHYQIQNQQNLILAVVDENLRETTNDKPGSASIEIKAKVAQTIYDMCNLKQINPSLVCGLIETESRWTIQLQSPSGAEGLMQVMSLYARPYLRNAGIDYSDNALMNPLTSIRIGISELADFQAEHVAKGRTTPDNWFLATHTYLWGPANSNQLFGKTDQRVAVPNLAYPQRVMDAAKKFKQRGIL